MRIIHHMFNYIERYQKTQQIISRYITTFTFIWCVI